MDPTPGHTFGGWVGQLPEFPQKPCEIVKIHVFTSIFHENLLIIMENYEKHGFSLFPHVFEVAGKLIHHPPKL
jgi:hypothetical protein